MSKDEATVARVADTIEGAIINAGPPLNAKQCKKFARVAAQAAIAALPSESGLVAALEDLIHQVEGLKQEEAESFDLDQARKALATRREGKPWSDSAPIVAGKYWHKWVNGVEDIVDVYAFNGDDVYYAHNGTKRVTKRGQWCGPLTPPKGGDT